MWKQVELYILFTSSKVGYIMNELVTSKSYAQGYLKVIEVL